MQLVVKKYNLLSCHVHAPFAHTYSRSVGRLGLDTDVIYIEYLRGLGSPLLRSQVLWE